MAKILRNTTASIIDLTKFGVTIPASGQITVVPQDYPLLAMPLIIAELSPLITAGTVVVNDGTNNLSVARGLDYLALPDYAYANRFNNTTNGYVATDVQTAIEEANKHLLAIEVSATANATTTSGTDALLTTMNITATPGTYLVWFTTTITSNNAGAIITVSLYNNNVQVPETVMKISPFDGGALSAPDARGSVAIAKMVTITAGALQVRWSTSGGTATCGPRVLNMLRVS